MKKILFLTFYYEPELTAGSFRNTPLAKELARQAGPGCEITVIAIKPNRYNSYKVHAPLYEKKDNLLVYRIDTPEHNSGFGGMIRSFYAYYKGARKIAKSNTYDLVYASSSRLFTAYLGYTVSKKQKIPLYLDIRDIFVDTMNDVLKSRLLKMGIMPVLHWVERKVFLHAVHINLISGGFKPYFKKYRKPTYSTYSNGVDEEFIQTDKTHIPHEGLKQVLYAGNIGEGQGLHIIIPQAAKELEGKYEFIVVGDGGIKARLVDELNRLNVTNVRMMNPVNRLALMELYKTTDFFFIHLNDYEAFKKVLPSKIFELSAFHQPIIAGVSGFARQFIEENVSNVITFDPGDVTTFVAELSNYPYRREERADFISRFKRSNLNIKMAASILSYVRSKDENAD